MTKAEAYKSMAEGRKVTHISYAPGEYLYLDVDGETVLDECGDDFTREFTNDQPNVGW